MNTKFKEGDVFKWGKFIVLFVGNPPGEDGVIGIVLNDLGGTTIRTVNINFDLHFNDPNSTVLGNIKEDILDFSRLLGGWE